MKELLRELQNDESGATAIEYGLIAALIALGIIAAVTLLGAEVVSMFDFVETEVTEATTARPRP